MNNVQIQRDICSLDDKIVQCVQSMNNSKTKRDFLLEFVNDPANFIRKWISSQTRDLEQILGVTRVNYEESKHAQFYRQDWVQEAIFHYLSARVRSRMQKLLNQ